MISYKKLLCKSSIFFWIHIVPLELPSWFLFSRNHTNFLWIGILYTTEVFIYIDTIHYFILCWFTGIEPTHWYYIKTIKHDLRNQFKAYPPFYISFSNANSMNSGCNHFSCAIIFPPVFYLSTSHKLRWKTRHIHIWFHIITMITSPILLSWHLFVLLISMSWTLYHSTYHFSYPSFNVSLCSLESDIPLLFANIICC